MYIDTHAHLFRADFGDELDAVIQRAVDAGIDKIIVPGTTLSTCREAVALADRYEFIFACVGIHPHEASSATREALGEIERMADHPKVVAIGEIGLDYHYDFSPSDQQKKVFREQILTAAAKNLPIVVHTRESLADALAIVDACALEVQAWNQKPQRPLGVFHCFTGNSREAKEVLSRRFQVSYPGIVTFRNSPVVQTVRDIGAENILLETDAPYMTPVPLRGRRNEPAYLVHTARKISEILGLPERGLGAITSKNAELLFGITEANVGLRGSDHSIHDGGSHASGS